MEIRKGKIAQPERVVVYGPEGIGKSTFASQFPDPLFIDTEGSTADLDVARLPDPKTWDELKDEIVYVRDHPDICRTLVIDTADWAERLCSRFILRKHQVDGIEDFGYGKGYIYLAEEFNRFLRTLNTVSAKGIHVVLTAHAQMRKFERPDESGAYDRWEMKLEKKNAQMVKEWSTMLLFADYNVIVIKDEKTKKAKAPGGERIMHTQHHACWDAKNRKGMPPTLPFTFDAIREYIPEISRTPQAAPQIPGKTPLEELRELMAKEAWRDGDVQSIVERKGFYPPGTPLEQYDPKFIKEAIVNRWENFRTALIGAAEKDIPF
jgi:hypothetical protein